MAILSRGDGSLVKTKLLTGILVYCLILSAYKIIDKFTVYSSQITFICYLERLIVWIMSTFE